MLRSRSLVSIVASTLIAMGSVSSCGDSASTTDITAIEVTAPDGSVSDLGSYLGERPLLISLWAVWCQPCRRELPELADIAGSGSVDVLALNIGDDRSRIDSFLDELGLDLPVATDFDGAILEALDAATVPVTVLLSPEGDVIWKHVGTVTREEIDSALT